METRIRARAGLGAFRGTPGLWAFLEPGWEGAGGSEGGQVLEGFKEETVPRAGGGLGGSPLGGVVGVETTIVEGLGDCFGGGGSGRGVKDRSGVWGLGPWAGLRGKLFPERRCGNGIEIVARAAWVRGGLLGGRLGVLA